MKRLMDLVLFLIAFTTIASLVVVAAIELSVLPVTSNQSQMRPDSPLQKTAWLIGCAGGFICAMILATKTAWAFYCHGKLGDVLNREI